MGGMKRLDAFVKARPELRSKSVAGGIITLVATSTAGLLFLAQIITYLMGRAHHSLHLARSAPAPLLPLNAPQSRRHKITLDLRVTFPHVECSLIEFAHDGAQFRTGELKKHHH